MKGSQEKMMNYRFKKINKDYLMTADSGRWIFLSEKQFNDFKTGKIDVELKKKLKENQMMSDFDNESKLISELRNKKAFLFSGPNLHIIVPTLRCNQQCVYCHASSKQIKERNYDMSLETSKKVVEFIFKTPVNQLTIEFQGGEPLLNFSVVKSIISYAKIQSEKTKKSIKFVLVSNLTLMNEERMEFLIKNDVDICTSSDGPSKLHDTNRKLSGAGSYEKVVYWIKKINKEYEKRKIDKKVTALLSLTKESLKYPEQIVDEYVSNGLNIMHVRYLNRLGCAKKEWEKLSYSPEEFVAFWKKVVEYMEDLNKKGATIRERMYDIMKAKIEGGEPNYLELRNPCGAVTGQLVYDFNGNIYSCDDARMLGSDLFKLGTVSDDYTDVVTSDKACKIIASSVTETQYCDACVYQPWCGICPVQNFAEQGNIIARIPETSRCKIHEKQFEYVLSKLNKTN